LHKRQLVVHGVQVWELVHQRVDRVVFCEVMLTSLFVSLVEQGVLAL